MNTTSQFSNTAVLKKEPKTLQAGLVGMTVFLIAGILNQIPPDFQWYVFHYNLRSFMFIITGGIQTFIWFLSILIVPFEDLDYFRIVSGVIIGFASGSLIYVFWVKHWGGKTIVIILFLINFAISAFVMILNGFFFVMPAGEVCKIALEDDIKIRVIGYPSILNSNLYGEYFVLSSVDDWQTWKQVMWQPYDAWDDYPPPPDCEGEDLHFAMMGEDMMWFWTDKNLSVSHDGGQSWQNWQSACGVREVCDYGHIMSVTFDDPQNGQMQVYVAGGNSKEIISSDGGLTWQSQGK
jgi:hypothetical protein